MERRIGQIFLHTMICGCTWDGTTLFREVVEGYFILLECIHRVDCLLLGRFVLFQSVDVLLYILGLKLS